MLKVSKEKNIIKLENIKNLSYKKKDKTIKSLPNKKVVYIEGKPGKDGKTPTPEQIIALIEPRIPKVKDGKDGKDGRNPMHIGENPPINPIIGDLWYQN